MSRLRLKTNQGQRNPCACHQTSWISVSSIYIYLPAAPCSRRFSVNETASRKRLPAENDLINMKKAAANVLVCLRRMEFSDAITSYISGTRRESHEKYRKTNGFSSNLILLYRFFRSPLRISRINSCFASPGWPRWPHRPARNNARSRPENGRQFCCEWADWWRHLLRSPCTELWSPVQSSWPFPPLFFCCPLFLIGYAPANRRRQIKRFTDTSAEHYILSFNGCYSTISSSFCQCFVTILEWRFPVRNR